MVCSFILKHILQLRKDRAVLTYIQGNRLVTLIIKKIKFFSYIRKFRRDRLRSQLKTSSYMVKYLRISSYIRKHFLIYDYATAHVNFLIFEENFVFFFISAPDTNHVGFLVYGFQKQKCRKKMLAALPSPAMRQMSSKIRHDFIFYT